MHLADSRDGHVELPPHVGRDHSGKELWWRVRCRDVIDRERFLTVLTDRDHVVLIGPPGETAVLSATQVDQLAEALRIATEQTRG